MKYALVGFGKMGRAIDNLAASRGHRRAVVVEPSGRGRGVARTMGAARWRGVDVAFEFTAPAVARDNVLELVRRGIPVVCGTTGWDGGDAEIAGAARRSRAGVLIASNFSVGINVFYRVVALAAREFLAVGEYDPWVLEAHHRGKKDAPSGTARALVQRIADGSRSRHAVVEGNPGGAALPSGAIHVASLRAGHETGRHEVGFDGPYDRITLEHVARDRRAFAHGAVLAAEWLIGRPGVHRFDDVLKDLLSKPRRGKGPRP